MSRSREYSLDLGGGILAVKMLFKDSPPSPKIVKALIF